MVNAADFKRQGTNLAFGQGISLCLSATGVFSQYLSRNNASAPTFQTLFLYVGLALVFVTYFYVRKRPSVDLPWWYWWLLGLVDVEANYFCVLAYRGIVNFAVLGLILHMTVPFVTILSYFVMRKRYMLEHIVGCAFAFAGCIVIFTHDNESAEYPDQGRGNAWSLAAAFLYGVSNLMSEYAVKRGGMDANVECLGKMGATAAVVSAIQIAIFERDTVAAVEWTPANIWYTFGYVLAMFTFYVVVSIFLRITESLMFNLSLLTADIYNAVANYVCFSNPVPGIYWLALSLNYVGTAVYSLKEPVQLPPAGAPIADDFSDVQTPSAKPIVLA
ncbi:Drug/Metabolite Transporter (DMT) Superfamily [Achlya hypogyna]|uniref:Drug/Metabolite Transporter (DMT) Superfamily n=1 Tax=Achlya hypogyna TaxID=1202772 RepID=A0A1V9Y9W6_ACHHY|nr:Drug/Metabolite Transporter (DMT) Superfamily [Achlya hypogyna]